MTTPGICANATFPESRLTAPSALALGVRWQRTITYWSEDRASWQTTIGNARELKKLGVQTLVVFNTEASGTAVMDVDLHAARLGAFLDMAAGAVACVEPGNELDTPGWGISDKLIVKIGRQCAAVCHTRGVSCLSPSLLTGPTEGRFEAVAAGLAGYVDGMAVHPYYCSLGGWPWPGWHFGTVEQKAQECQERSHGLPTWFTELGCPSGYDGIGLDRQASFAGALRAFDHPAIEVAFLFAFNDAMVPGGELKEGKDWGLADGKFNQKPAWAAFARPILLPDPVVAVPPSPVLSPPENRPHYVLGFQAAAAAAPDIIGLPQEDERGPTRGMSWQRTTNGRLLWANLVEGPVIAFWHDDGRRYLWREVAAELVEIA